jgi:hypothetical protein
MLQIFLLRNDEKITKFILGSSALFSLMMDESTTVSNRTALIVYIRTLDPRGMQNRVIDFVFNLLSPLLHDLMDEYS